MSEAAAQGGSRPAGGIARMFSDDRLVRRAGDGDERAFAAIFRRYHQDLYRFCLAIVGNSDDAQDALQNTMVKAMRALPGEQRRIELKPWLYRVAHNEAVELLRRRRGTEQLDPELAGQRPGPAEESALRERLRRLMSDLDELPERQRGALVMRELSGLGFEEIGAALGTSAAVARQTLYEARLSLRQMEEGREMTCGEVTSALSDADGRVLRRRDLRAHLRSCQSCRAFRDAIGGRERDFAALSPLPAAAAAGMLHGLLGGHGGSGGIAAALGGGAAKSLGASAAIKGVATVAVVAAVGVSAADYGGAIHLGLPADGGSSAGSSSRPADAPGAVVLPGAGARAPTDRRSALKRSTSRAGLTAAERARRRAAATDALKAKGGGEGRSRSHGPSAARHSGRGHEKTPPSASAHGQQTAAAHKTSSHGGGNGSSPPAAPAKAPQPSHPVDSGAKAAPPPPPHEAAPKVEESPPPPEETTPSSPPDAS